MTNYFLPSYFGPFPAAPSPVVPPSSTLSYSNLTFLQARDQLALSLGNPGKTFWTDAELGLYLKEALSIWAVASLTYRQRATFLSTANQAFYDLTSIISDLALTSTDRDIASMLEYSLIEPQSIDWSVWSGTQQFSLSAIQEAIQAAQHQFLLETGMLLTSTEIPTASPPVSRVPFSTTTLDIRRVAAKNLSNQYKPLSLEDSETLQAYVDDWNIPSSSEAKYYSLLTEPIVILQLAPVASDILSLHLLTIEQGQPLDLSTGKTINIIEPFYWALKYGALSQLLGPGIEANDASRLAYCKRRWAESLALAKIYLSILNAEINGRQVSITSLADLDMYKWNWQNQSGTPTQLAMASWNLIALSPIPSSNGTSITIDFIKNPPLPVADNDYIQLDEYILPIVLDFARHLAFFKKGGAEFLSSTSSYDRLVQAAALQNGRLKAQSKLFSSLTDHPSREIVQRPIFEKKEEGQGEEVAA